MGALDRLLELLRIAEQDHALRGRAAGLASRTFYMQRGGGLPL
jgi:hypothetical protein